jgi:hypothetical protein
MAAKDPAHRCRRYPDAELAALADDAEIPPTEVAPGQPQHKLDHLLIKTAPVGSGVREGPAAGDQLPVPTQQRRRRDQNLDELEARLHEVEKPDKNVTPTGVSRVVENSSEPRVFR